MIDKKRGLKSDPASLYVILALLHGLILCTISSMLNSSVAVAVISLGLATPFLIFRRQLAKALPRADVLMTNAARLGRLSLSRSALFAVAAFIVLMSHYLSVSALLPSYVQREGLEILEWGLTDKRLFFNAYLFALVTFAFLAYVARGFPSSDPMMGQERSAKIPSKIIDRVLLGQTPSLRSIWFVLGACVALSLLSAFVSEPPIFDMHMGVHMGSWQAMDQGAIPYVQARTQYGPGNQVLLYRIMHFLDVSYFGALVAQYTINLCVLGLFGALLFWFCGPVIGCLAIFALLILPSPVFVADFPGWGLLTRWIGTVMVGFLLAEVLFSDRRKSLIYLVAIGIIWGGGAFLSQENFSTGLVASVFVFGFSLINPNNTLHTTVKAFVIFFLAAAVCFCLCLAATVGWEYLPRAFSLYMEGPKLVSAGISNAWWSPKEFSFGGNIIYLIAAPFYLFVFLLMSLFVRTPTNSQERLAVKVLVGVMSVGAALHAVTMLRVDLAHLQGPSFLMGTAMITFAMFFSPLIHMPLKWKRILGGVFCAFFFLILIEFMVQPHKRARVSFGPGKALQDLAGMIDTARTGQQKDLGAHSVPPERRMYPFEGNAWTRKLSEWFERNGIGDCFQRLHQALDGRSVVIDRKITQIYELEYNVGFMYFAANLKVGSAITDPSVSIWTDRQLERWKEELAAHPPECLVTADASEDYPSLWPWFAEQLYQGHVTLDKLGDGDCPFVLVCGQGAQ